MWVWLLTSKGSPWSSRRVAITRVQATVDQTEREGAFNPLLYAANKGHLEVVRLLLEAGADVNARSADSLNPLDYAELSKEEGRGSGQPFDEVIALLERYGATRSA